MRMTGVQPVLPESLTPKVDLESLRTQFDLTGKAAFVPGGYGALGEAISWALAFHGARIFVAGPSAEKAGSLAGEIAAAGYQAVSGALDARSVSDIRRVTEEAIGALGCIDILVNCVGIQREQPLLEVTEEMFDLVYETNLKSAMFLAQAVARHQVERNIAGRHIHLLSVRSQLALAGRGYSAYCSTKGGLLMLVKQHAVELAPHNITVNGVAPTFIQSDRIRPHLDRAEFRDYILARNPLRRIGHPIEVAGPVVALAAPAGSYMTGQVIFVDGGITASQ
jgi:NAD(P)-dependent dehydrogenase (short-subunit alcohol dehydrogenase family)